jgi:outer membrane lipoprotein-sorting protein
MRRKTLHGRLPELQSIVARLLVFSFKEPFMLWTRTAAAAAGLILIAPVAPAQTVDEIVAKNIEARGGIERLRGVQTVKTTGKLVAPPRFATSPDAKGIEMPMTIWVKRPNLVRRETTFPDRTVTVGFDGTTVWGLDSTVGKPQQMTGPQADATRDDADIDPLLLDYKQKGHRVQLVGQEKIDGQPVHHLRVTRKNGKVSDYFISTETGLEVRIVDMFEQGGMKMEVRTDLSNYQTVDGMRLPFTIKQFSNGVLAVEFNLEKVEFNTPVDAEIFRMK